MSENSTYQALGEKVQEIGRLKQQLTTEREKCLQIHAAHGKLLQQLTAEREKLDTLEKQLAAERELRERAETAMHIAEHDALVRCDERDKARQQLTNEREKADNLFKVARKHSVENNRLRVVCHRRWQLLRRIRADRKQLREQLKRAQDFSYLCHQQLAKDGT